MSSLYTLDTNTTIQDEETSSVNSSVNSQEASLEELITTMAKQSDFLHHRLDSIQRLLDQETFEFSSRPLKVAPVAKASQVRKLLDEIGVTEEELTMEIFLKALNRWLICQELVDLNDLQIHLSPLVASAFQKAPGLKKVPYCLLLASLPKMFI